MTADRHRRVRRRQFLAGLAATAGVGLAGCSGIALPWEDETSPSFTASDADAVFADASAPSPTIEWPAPVTPGPGALEETLDRIDSLLESVPSSLTPDDVPNGVVREEIAGKRDDAIEIRDEAADATGRDLYRTLRETRTARDAARASVTTLTAIDADRKRLVAELEDEHEAVRSAVRDRRGETGYRGVDTDDGRLRAALYWYRRAFDLGRAERTLERWDVDANANVIDVGDAAGDLEFATATASVWDHFGERYDAALDDPVDLESVFETALERSIERADEVEFPDQDGDDWYDAVGLSELEDQRLEFLVWRVGRAVGDAREGLETASADGDLATGLARALEFEQAFRAFETVRDRIADGTLAVPETVDEIRTERQAALEAAAAAREALPVSEPSLGVYRLAATLQSLVWTDDTVRRAADNDPEVIVSLGDEYGDYARVRAELEALPDAVTAFRERLLAD